VVRIRQRVESKPQLMRKMVIALVVSSPHSGLLHTILICDETLLMFCLTRTRYTARLPHSTKTTQPNKLHKGTPAMFSSHSFTIGVTSKLEQPSTYQTNLIMQMSTQLQHTLANPRMLYEKRCTFICDSTLTASLGSSVTMLKQPMRCPYRPMFLA